MKKVLFIQVGLLIWINVFICMTVNAQGIDSCSNVTVSLYELQYNDSVRYIENYEIYNDYSEPLWMWISRVPVKGLTVRQLRHDFMIKQFSDDPMSINMDLLMCDLVTFPEIPSIALGYTFIKEILPKTSFNISIIKKSKDEITDWPSKFVIIKKSSLGIPSNYPPNKEVLFKPSTLVIPHE